jgi:hypothetical protein
MSIESMAARVFDLWVWGKRFGASRLDVVQLVEFELNEVNQRCILKANGAQERVELSLGEVASYDAHVVTGRDFVPADHREAASATSAVDAKAVATTTVVRDPGHEVVVVRRPLLVTDLAVS